MKSFKLNDIDKKGQLFKVPEGYFEDLPMRIQQKIETSQKSKTSWVSTPVFRVALSVASIFIVILMFTLINGSETPEELLSEVSQEELLAYIDYMSLEEDEILTAFEKTFQTMDFSNETELDELELEDESLDELINVYDLTDEYL